MFAHDLCHSQIEYLSLRLVDPTARRGILPVESLRVERSILIKRQSDTRRKGLRCASDFHKYSIFNSQFRLVRVGIPQERIATRLGLDQKTIHYHLGKKAELPFSPNNELRRGCTVSQVAEKHACPVGPEDRTGVGQSLSSGR